MFWRATLLQFMMWKYVVCQWHISSNCFTLDSNVITVFANKIFWQNSEQFTYIGGLTVVVYRRRSGWNSGGRMVSAEGSSVPSGVEYGEGGSLSNQLWVWERCKLPHGSGAEPWPKRDFGVFLGHRTFLFVLIWQHLRGTIYISVPSAEFWGTCLLVHTWYYVHVIVYDKFANIFYLVYT